MAILSSYLYLVTSSNGEEPADKPVRYSPVFNVTMIADLGNTDKSVLSFILLHIDTYTKLGLFRQITLKTTNCRKAEINLVNLKGAIPLCIVNYLLY